MAAQMQALFSLTVTEGPDKGSQFQLIASPLTLGRCSTNDIVLHDPRVSRQHIRIEIQFGAVSITNLSEKAAIYVNGEVTDTCVLQNDAQIRVGQTVLKFSAQTPSIEQALVSVPSGQLAETSRPELAPQEASLAENGYPSAPTVGQRKRSSRSSRRRKGQSKINFYMMVGVIGSVFAYLLMDSPTESKKPTELRSSESVNRDINAIEEQIIDVEKQRHEEGKDSTEYKLAHPHFVKGMRDFQQAQFERAMESFQACLSIFSQHQLCQRYYHLANKHFSELVQYHMIQGRRYKEKGQYGPCRSAFNNVMVMVKDKTNPRFEEALVNYKYCNTMLKERF